MHNNVDFNNYMNYYELKQMIKKQTLRKKKLAGRRGETAYTKPWAVFFTTIAHVVSLYVR